MKIINLILLSFLCFLFFSCNTEILQNPDSDQIEEKLNVSADSLTQKEVPQGGEEEEVQNAPKDALTAYIQLKEEMKKKLDSCTPQFANQLYMEFREKSSVIAGKLTFADMKMLDDYDELYDNDGLWKLSGKYGAQIKKYLKQGLELWYIGEGMTEIRVRPAEFSSLFSGRVTNDFQEFMELEELDNRELITNDAAIAISWDRLAMIVRNWENFVQRNPKSSLKKEAQANYDRYQRWYLFGLDNTPAVEYSNGLIYEENKFSFKLFMSYYPESQTSQLIKKLMDFEGDFDEMQNQVEAMKKNLIKM